MITSQTVVVTGPIPTDEGTVPVSNGADKYNPIPLAETPILFSAIANNGGSSGAQFVVGNANLATSGSAIEYPAVKTTTQAILVINMKTNGSSSAVNISLTSDGGLTPLGTVNFAAGVTGVKPNASVPAFAFPLTGRTDKWDLMVSFVAGGAGAIQFSASVELIP